MSPSTEVVEKNLYSFETNKSDINSCRDFFNERLIDGSFDFHIDIK